MSARQPFVPSSRPASRAAHLKDTTESSTSSFTADPDNPLHLSFSHSLTTQTEKEFENNSFPSTGTNNKPLNLSSFVKKKPSHAEQPGLVGESRKQSGITRPGTADILPGDQVPRRRLSGLVGQYHAPALNIAAPTPTSPYASNPSTLLSANKFTFKAPALPMSAAKLLPGQSSDNVVSDSAHIFTESAEIAPNMLASGLLPQSLLESTAQGVHPSAEVIERRDPPGFGMNTPGAKEGGAQRVLVDISADNLEPRRMVGKRGRGNQFDDDASEDEYVRQVKRYKYNVQVKEGSFTADHGRQMEYSAPAPTSHSSRHSTPTSHHSYNQDRGPASPENAFTQHNAGTLSPSTRRPTRRHHQSRPTSFQNEDHHHQLGTLESPLSKIFGKDIDTYIEENLDAYEAAQKRWRACTMEEWIAGADEICASFGQVLDFVKDHMSAKVKLYASLNKKLDDHSTVLEERDKALGGARASLVKEGGNVLGGV